MSKILIATVLVSALCYVNGEMCGCPKILTPVCGSDYQTYINTCEFNCARRVKTDLTIAYNGRCKSPKMSPKVEEHSECSCTMEFSPVCGTNGRTYSSPCLLECEQNAISDLKIAHKGVCKTPKVPAAEKKENSKCSCTLEYSPVCGSNGRTYSSPCYLECDQQKSSDLKISHVGSCRIEKAPATKQGDRAKCSCPMEFSPVCGNNGRTYSSPCLLECEQKATSDLKIAHNGVCKTPKVSSTKKNEASKCSCTMEFSPVCGSNGRTYSSPCYLECEQQLSSDLKIAHVGSCQIAKVPATKKDDHAKCSCTMEFNPVCGSNGRTYSSPCYLGCDQQVSSDLKMSHVGSCQIAKSSATKKDDHAKCSCTMEFNPVCGSNGRTYSSPCYLECDQQLSSDLKMAHVGSCQIAKVPAAKKEDSAKCSCTMEFSPVCGNNGRTYSSPCYLECDQTKTSDLKIAHNGVCKMPKVSSTKMDEAPKCSCTMEFSPVCGSNGRTYSSPCLLECEQKLSTGLRLAHKGPCA